MDENLLASVVAYPASLSLYNLRLCSKLTSSAISYVISSKATLVVSSKATLVVRSKATVDVGSKSLVLSR